MRKPKVSIKERQRRISEGLRLMWAAKKKQKPSSGAMTMDPEANMKEQSELAANVMRIWDACDEDGEFTEDQKQNLICDAYRLADLIQAMEGWKKSGGFST